MSILRKVNSVKVILLKDVKGTGKKGDIIEASDGHARNYLIPRKLAKLATDGNVKEQAHIKSKEDERKANEIAEAKALAEKISSLTIELKSKAGEGGKLFGSISTKDLAEALNSQHKIKIDKRKFVLDGAIKELGVKEIDVKVYPAIAGKLKVNIIPE